MIGRIVGLIMVMLLLLGLPGMVQADVPAGPALTLAEGEALAAQYFQGIMAQGSQTLAQQILDPAFQRIDRNLQGEVLDLYGFRVATSFQRNGFTELHYYIDAVAVDGPMVAVCWTAAGELADGFTVTQTDHVTTYLMDEYHGPLGMTPKPVRSAHWTGMTFLAVADGKIVQDMTNMEAIDLQVTPKVYQELQEHGAVF